MRSGVAGDGDRHADVVETSGVAKILGPWDVEDDVAEDAEVVTDRLDAVPIAGGGREVIDGGAERERGSGNRSRHPRWP